MINNLQDHFNNNEGVRIAAKLEELAIERLKGNIEVMEKIMTESVFIRYSRLVNPSELHKEFMYLRGVLRVDDISSLLTLVECIKKEDIKMIWSVAKNFMNLIKIILCKAPASTTAERTFSCMGLVKNKLRNSMGDTRFSDLCMLAQYPDILDDIDIIKICNTFVQKTTYTNRRMKVFGKFVPSDLDFLPMESPDIFKIMLPIQEDNVESALSDNAIDNTMLEQSDDENKPVAD